jgi:hypothetical protein
MRVVGGRVCQTTPSLRECPLNISQCRVPPGARTAVLRRGTVIARHDAGLRAVPGAVSWCEHQPNRRLKLAARAGLGTIPFVITEAVRRSLSAVR